jgi:hypothetical protein
MQGPSEKASCQDSHLAAGLASNTHSMLRSNSTTLSVTQKDAPFSSLPVVNGRCVLVVVSLNAD